MRFSEIINSVLRLESLHVALESTQINEGRILAALNRQADYPDLQDYEFKVFSQFGEDGIVQHLIDKIDVCARTFIEFGIESFAESNCRFLMMKDNWRGFVIDGSARNIERLRASYFFWRYDLTAIQSFITRDNVRELVAQAPFSDLGILSIDIDGMDWHILKQLDNVAPAILIVEYNGVFGSRAAVTVPYDPGFQRTLAHHSNLYFGASLSAFATLARKRGYSLVGSNSAGNNAFFVRDDLINGAIKPVPVSSAFRRTHFREARDASGQLSFPHQAERRSLIADLPLIDVETGQTLRVADLPPEQP